MVGGSRDVKQTQYAVDTLIRKAEETLVVPETEKLNVKWFEVKVRDFELLWNEMAEQYAVDCEAAKGRERERDLAIYMAEEFFDLDKENLRMVLELM